MEYCCPVSASAQPWNFIANADARVPQDTHPETRLPDYAVWYADIQRQLISAGTD